jgi:hypothetical protein
MSQSVVVTAENIKIGFCPLMLKARFVRITGPAILGELDEQLRTSKLVVSINGTQAVAKTHASFIQERFDLF